MRKDSILLAVSGETPQILTETLYQLKIRYEREESYTNVVKIHVITTSKGRSNLKKITSDGVDGGVGIIEQMCNEYGWDQVEFKDENIHVITDGNGEELSDIRTDEDESVAANFMFGTISDLMKTYPDMPIIASIAGGRKTMSYLLGSAMSLLGRVDDELTHVLVDSDAEKIDRKIEGNEFYYPTKHPRLLKTIDGGDVDASKVKIDLSFIPFIKLGHILSDSKRGKRILNANVSNDAYSSAIKLINDEMRIKPEDVSLELDWNRVAIRVMSKFSDSPVVIELKPADFAFYAMILHNQKYPDIAVAKPDKNMHEKKILRYWLKLFSFTPIPNENVHATEIVTEVNKIIESYNNCTNKNHFKWREHSIFRGIYDSVVGGWDDYASSINIKRFNKGMGQCAGEKNKNLLQESTSLDPDKAFREAQMSYWKERQGAVNKVIAKAGFSSVVADLLIVAENNKRYGIKLKKENIDTGNCPTLEFNELR